MTVDFELGKKVVEMKFYIQPELKENVTAPEQCTWDVEVMRKEADQLFSTPKDYGAVLHDADGVPVRVFESGSPKYLIVAPHGGGYVAGRALYDDERNAFIARNFSAVVVSPEYRLAPEFPFPAGRDDVIKAARWARAQYPDLPLFFYGDSAGSGLSYVAAFHVDGLAGLILLEPCVDPEMKQKSVETFADGPVWTKRAGECAWESYRGEVPGPSSVLPPTLVVVNPVDPLRDEGIALACGIVDAGVECSLHMWEGTFHGALGYPVDSWREMNGVIGRFLARHGGN